MSEPRAIPGRCLCGAVRIELEPPTDFLSICHCESCRLSHGAPFVAWTSVPRDRFRLLAGEERVRWYRSSPAIEWGFCDTCGSPLLYRADRAGHPESPRLDHVYVSAGSLQGPLDRPVAAHVSFEEKVPWYSPADGIPRHRAKTDERLDD